jgi:hypothetical protein
MADCRKITGNIMENQYMKTQTVSILDYIHHRVILSALPQSALSVRFWATCCGHIVIAGSFSALVRRILENSAWQGAGSRVQEIIVS